MAHSELSMVRHTNNMILSMTILIVCPVRFVLSMDWKEKNMEAVVITVPEDEIDKTKCLDQLNGFCRSGREFSNNVMDNFVKKKSSLNFAEMPGNARIIPFYRSSQRNVCTCGLEHRMIDLGRAYYPRYLPTGACTADSCTHHYQCVEKKYKVRVLKQKDFADPAYSESMGLPANLRELWKAETLSVVVACQCVPSTEKYENT